MFRNLRQPFAYRVSSTFSLNYIILCCRPKYLIISFPTGTPSRFGIVPRLFLASLRVRGRERARTTASRFPVRLRQNFQIGSDVFRKISIPESHFLLWSWRRTKSHLYLAVWLMISRCNLNIISLIHTLIYKYNYLLTDLKQNKEKESN